MIVVNIRVPALEKVYNFSVEEKAKIDDLIEEIVELVKQKEGVQFHGALDQLALCSVEKGLQCNKECILTDYGICDGDELILV